MSGFDIDEVIAESAEDLSLGMDLSHLDDYRRGSDGVRPHDEAPRTRDAQPEPDGATEDAGLDAGDGDRHYDRDDEPPRSTSSGSSSRGSSRRGSTGISTVSATRAAGGSQVVPVDRSDRPPDPPAPARTSGGPAVSDAEPSAEELHADPGAASGPSTPDPRLRPEASSLDKTDHQEAAQDLGTTGVRGGTGDGAAVLPATGFSLRLPEQAARPAFKGTPRDLLDRLLATLVTTAVRELGVSETAAKQFAQGMSQTALVVAFLSAQLDVDLDVDASTRQATRLFRAQNPLLGSVVKRLLALEELERETRDVLERLDGEVRAVSERSAVLEQGTAFLIADTVENLGRGIASVVDLDFNHRSAIRMRDRAREATRRQADIEKRQDGRPMR